MSEDKRRPYCDGGPNCTPFWELPQAEQDVITTELAVHKAKGGAFYKNSGAGEKLEARCRKCGEMKLRYTRGDDESWCRRCRYYYFEEYFGFED